MIYGSWNIRCNRQIFVILCHFFVLSALWQPKKPKFWNWKKTPGDIIILHICAINKNHTMQGSWDIECNGQIFLSLWAIFCPFTPLTTKKSKFWKNEKRATRYYHFTHVYHKWQSYDAWYLGYRAWHQIFLSFWTIFCSFAP